MQRLWLIIFFRISSRQQFFLNCKIGEKGDDFFWYTCKYNKIALLYIGICLNKICSNQNIAWFIMNINLILLCKLKTNGIYRFLWKDTPGKKIKMMTCHLKLNTHIIFLQCQLCYPHTYRFTITDTFTNNEAIKVYTLKNYIKLQSNQRVTHEFLSPFQCWLLA